MKQKDISAQLQLLDYFVNCSNDVLVISLVRSI
jgi:hypothetical protein